MEFWPEFLASSWGKELAAGGIGGMAGVVAGHPLDTLRIRLQQPGRHAATAVGLLRSIVASEGPAALYRGMAAPLASVTFQNAVAFQVYAVLSRAIDPFSNVNEPPSYRSVALAGVGTGALQSVMLSPVELVKIRLQLQMAGSKRHRNECEGPVCIAKKILKNEGLRGIYRGFSITILRDAPAHGVYFWTYERSRELLHPGCRKDGRESMGTMLVAGGFAGVASWVVCYPLDVVKSRIQAQSSKYDGIVDCLRKSVGKEGYGVLWRGLGTAVARAFVVNGAIFTAYELALRFMADSHQRIVLEEIQS